MVAGDDDPRKIAADDDSTISEVVEQALEPYRALLGPDMLEVFREELTHAIETHPVATQLLERHRAAAEAARRPVDKDEEKLFGVFEPARPPAAWLDDKKRRELVTEGLKVVERLATRVALRHRTLPRDDLVSLGCIGLMEALRRYDPARGAFEPFARARIEGAMFDGLRREVPHAQALAAAHAFGGEYLESRLPEGNLLSDTPEQERQHVQDFSDGLLASMATGYSLEASRGAENALAERQVFQLLETAKGELDSAHQEVIDLRYKHDHDMREVARRLGIPYAKARNRHIIAMQQLGRRMTSQGISSAGR